MKYVKILGLLAVAAAAMMAFAASASATSVTTATGGPTVTENFHAINESGKHLVLTNPIANIECQSTVEGNVESHGTGVTTRGRINTLLFTGCTNEWHVTTVKPGGFEVHWTSGHNGTFRSAEALVNTTRFGVNCNYETNATHIGTVTGGNPATLHIVAKISLAASSSFLCGSGPAKWEGAYVTTGALYVEK